jgi:cytoskeletal protein CcmA (bactofilin family)
MNRTDKIDPGTKQTTVEEGTEFKGTLHSQCQVVIRGSVEGDLKAPSVIVSETGTLVGNIQADCVQSGGVLAGRVNAEEIYLSGSVRSDTVIRAKTLEVKLARPDGKLEVTFGECVLDVGDDPSAEVADASRNEGSNKSGRSRRPLSPAGDNAEAKPNEENKSGIEEGGNRSAPPTPS